MLRVLVLFVSFTTFFAAPGKSNFLTVKGLQFSNPFTGLQHHKTLIFPSEEFFISIPFASYRDIHPILSPIIYVNSLDRDQDGVLDSLDKCPDEKGTLQYDGCPAPDSDNDGLTDDIDKCPTVAGPVYLKGCPPEDKDGDKINDDEDKCPEQAGVARFDGCMTKDTDKDGVDDDDDKCIDIPGTLTNLGCPGNNSAGTAGTTLPKRKRKHK